MTNTVVIKRQAAAPSVVWRQIPAPEANEFAEGSGEESWMDECSARALNQELSRAPTPALSGRIALPDILSRSPTPLAPYRPQPMLGSRAPTSIFEVDSPRAATPLFFPGQRCLVPKPRARRASSLKHLSPSTAKRQRLEPPKHDPLKGFAKKLFDLEAEDDSDDEDDGDDESEGFPMAEFIDDDPVNDAPIVVVDDGTDEDAFAFQATEAERLAAHCLHPLTTSCLDFRTLAIRTCTDSQSPEEANCSSCNIFPDAAGSSRFSFVNVVPAGGKKRPKFETVAIYVETDNLVALQHAMAKYSGGYAMRSRKPVLIDVQDRQSTLDLRSIISPVGRWARDESLYLVVPRLSYGNPLAHSEHRLGTQLFDTQEFRATQNKHERNLTRDGFGMAETLLTASKSVSSRPANLFSTASFPVRIRQAQRTEVNSKNSVYCQNAK
ncbi:hypothetical protein C8R47DRAFT_1327899 [Mycena vitilis]|nr:hypothetical protein C8R47DRAFT_1327899 [Mycena vitilis]